jgi:hypothetical protein
MPGARVVWDAPRAFVVHVQWRPAGEQNDRAMFQVLRMDDDKICEIADYPTLGPATKAAKRFAAA